MYQLSIFFLLVRTEKRLKEYELFFNYYIKYLITLIKYVIQSFWLIFLNNSLRKRSSITYSHSDLQI